MATTARTVRITTEPVTPDEVVAVADGARVELSDDARTRIEAARQVVDAAIARGEAIYGVTTGVGHARDERLPPEALTAMQPVLLEMHAGGMGDTLPARQVRAAMVTRLVGISRGGAGTSLAVAEALAGLLNGGIHPVVASVASVGAGDLGQLAAVGRALIGRGEVEVDGRRVPAGEALTSAGFEPIALAPKDALAIMSANAVAVGHAALVLARLARATVLADLTAAVALEAVSGNPSVVDPAVAAARSSPGQVATSAAIRTALDGSGPTSPDRRRSVQDPLSFRVVPQVHGALRDLAAGAEAACSAELNGPTDNPMVDIDGDRVISNGNFAPMNLALAFEALRVAIAHVGILSDRRVGHLWDAAVTSLGAAGPPAAGPGDEPGDGSGGGPPGMLVGLNLRYPSAALGTRLRQLAAPVTLDVPILDLGVEDHASNLPEAVARTEEAIRLLEEILAVELLVALVPLTVTPDVGALGAGTGPLVDLLRTTLARLPPGTASQDAHRHVLTVLLDHLTPTPGA